MLNANHTLREKQETLKALAAKAKATSNGFSQPSEKASNEQKMLEGEQGSHEQIINELKTAVEELTTAVECIDTRSRDLKNDMQEQLLSMREIYALKAHRFVWLWSVALIVILVLQGSDAPSVHIFFFEFKAHKFHLDNSVLIALISGVTVNIVAVFVVVMRNLFPSDIKRNSKYKKNKTESN